MAAAKAVVGLEKAILPAAMYNLPIWPPSYPGVNIEDVAERDSDPVPVKPDVGKLAGTE